MKKQQPRMSPKSQSVPNPMLSAVRGGAWYAKYDGVDGSSITVQQSSVRK